MGAVYRAIDTKLNREVAIKILPESFAKDADRLARFQREAQVLASLNHPHIAQIYGVEERALIMELVEGPTLADRIAAGALTLDEVLSILGQLVDALEYAHEKNVVHRDLKPANIKITPDGRVKVLDFGLAKALTPEMASGNPASSPTLTMRSAIGGTLLGTAAYMAPEQARGQEVDKRADIWAFGVVIHELATGQRLFEGPTISDTLAAVLTREPAFDHVPARLLRLLRLCLQKDARRRLRDIGDARALLDEVPEPQAAQPSRRSILPWILAGALAIGLVILLWRDNRSTDKPLTRLDLDLGPDAVAGLNLTVAISPDGRRIVYPVRGPDGKQQLATRLLDQARATLLPGTEDGRDPFFSPDSQSIGFFAGLQLTRISVLGGAPLSIGTTSNLGIGAHWDADDSITAAMGSLVPIARVPAFGGPLTTLTQMGPGEMTHRWPQALPGGRGVLFTTSSSLYMQSTSSIAGISSRTGTIKTITRGGYYARYLPTGHLVFLRDGVLFGVPFDTDRLEMRGTPVPLLDDVASNPSTGGGQFDFSATGTFVYTTGKGVAQAWQMVWLDSSGKTESILKMPGLYVLPRISPDGRKVAFAGAGPAIYIHDLERDTTTRVTASASASYPIWAPDSTHIVYQSATDGFSLYWTRADGAGEPTLLLKSSTEVTVPWCFSSDGRWLAYFRSAPPVRANIWILPVDASDPKHPKPGQPEQFLSSSSTENLPRFSPDGRWIVYRSNESGRDEIYVRPFPAKDGGKSQISSEGGLYGLWSNNGHELFYETSDNQIRVVDYRVEGHTFIPGKPRLWSDKRILYSGTSNIDIAPDGKRFLVMMSQEAAAGEKSPVHVTMLLNFFDEVKRRIPLK